MLVIITLSKNMAYIYGHQETFLLGKLRTYGNQHLT